MISTSSNRRQTAGTGLLTRFIQILLSIAAVQLSLGAQAADSSRDGSDFSPQWVIDQARMRAAMPYAASELAADSPLRDLDYDDYRRIFFAGGKSIWEQGGYPFRLQLFHPGFIYNQPVNLHLVENGVASALPFSTEYFDYHPDLTDLTRSLSAIPSGSAQIGYAGFRVHHPINNQSVYDEFLVFLGASYFRAVGENQFYGLSARGLGVNTVGPGDEEFPRFSDFWIERPEHDSQAIVVHGLLDSRSVTGAFQFYVTPGAPTEIEVDATLFPRVDLPRVGIAPLTSMFLFDATNRDAFDDYRNAVHDSDGLQVKLANGETLWRPLANPADVQVSVFQAPQPEGFGLLQRHQQFSDYNDDEARYDKRTSLWIEPLDDWGAGHVELLEIPTGVETSDNIVAYWQPADGLAAGTPQRFRYRMYWGLESPASAEIGRVVNTAAGLENGREQLFVIDYSGGEQIADVRSDSGSVLIHATTSAGVITGTSGTLVEATGNYRAYVKLDPAGADLAELHVTLEVAGERWGETWLYRWTP